MPQLNGISQADPARLNELKNDVQSMAQFLRTRGMGTVDAELEDDNSVAFNMCRSIKAIVRETKPNMPSPVRPSPSRRGEGACLFFPGGTLIPNDRFFGVS